MQDLDELMSATVDHLARLVDPAGALERTVGRKRRRRVVRRVQTLSIVGVFLAATAVGTFALAKSFRVGHVRRPGAPRVVRLPLTGNGKIAFASDADGGQGNWDIYVMNPDGSGLTRLTSDPNVESRPAWLPDGTKIAFERATADGSDPGIFVMNADGSGVKELVGGAGGSKPAFSPDGKRIAFARGSEIYVMNADGSHVTQLTHSGEGVADYPAWSPDGARIAFTSGIANQGALFIVNQDGSGLHRIFIEHDPNVADILRPGSWSPDGSKMLFEREPTGGSKDQSVGGIWSISPDGTGLVRIGANRADGFASWSPDGRKILFIRDDRDVYVMNADGTELMKLTSDSGVKYFTSWQPIATP
jgi:TolB protein